MFGIRYCATYLSTRVITWLSICYVFVLLLFVTATIYMKANQASALLASTLLCQTTSKNLLYGDANRQQNFNDGALLHSFCSLTSPKYVYWGYATRLLIFDLLRGLSFQSLVICFRRCKHTTNCSVFFRKNPFNTSVCPKLTVFLL